MLNQNNINNINSIDNQPNSNINANPNNAYPNEFRLQQLQQMSQLSLNNNMNSNLINNPNLNNHISNTNIIPHNSNTISNLQFKGGHNMINNIKINNNK